jgi:hypothetical protein
MRTRAEFERPLSPFLLCPQLTPRVAGGGPVCRLGLATRGDTELTPSDVQLALDHGINFLNWCGTPNAMSQAIAGLGSRREESSCVCNSKRVPPCRIKRADSELDRVCRSLRIP